MMSVPVDPAGWTSSCSLSTPVSKSWVGSGVDSVLDRVDRSSTSIRYPLSVLTARSRPALIQRRIVLSERTDSRAAAVMDTALDAVLNMGVDAVVIMSSQPTPYGVTARVPGRRL